MVVFTCPNIPQTGVLENYLVSLQSELPSPNFLEHGVCTSSRSILSAYQLQLQALIKSFAPSITFIWSHWTCSSWYRNSPEKKGYLITWSRHACNQMPTDLSKGHGTSCHTSTPHTHTPRISATFSILAFTRHVPYARALRVPNAQSSVPYLGDGSWPVLGTGFLRAGDCGGVVDCLTAKDGLAKPLCVGAWGRLRLFTSSAVLGRAGSRLLTWIGSRLRTNSRKKKTHTKHHVPWNMSLTKVTLQNNSTYWSDRIRNKC